LLGATDLGLEYMLEESFTLSIRYGNWKYIAPQEKGTPDWLKNKKIESGLEQQPQLYDLDTDPGEINNVAAQHPELVQQLQGALKNIQSATNSKGR
jgi:arylsulfatase A